MAPLYVKTLLEQAFGRWRGGVRDVACPKGRVPRVRAGHAGVSRCPPFPAPACFRWFPVAEHAGENDVGQPRFSALIAIIEGIPPARRSSKQARPSSGSAAGPRP